MTFFSQSDSIKMCFYTVESGRVCYLNINNKLMEGVIKKLTDKGFGFIAREGEEKDLFFHSNSLVGVGFTDLHEGDKVTFEVEQTDKGPAAVKVAKA